MQDRADEHSHPKRKRQTSATWGTAFVPLNSRRRWSLRALYVATVLSVAMTGACHKAPAVPMLALEECDPAGYLACMQQEAFASIPVTDTGLFLTYSSRWSPSPSGQHVWDAGALGLGGWSINFVQRYDKASRVFMSGDGSWRLTESVALPSGETAVPSYNGSLAYVFDSSGHHVRTMDAHLGTQLIKISYDSAGRLTKLDGVMNAQPVHVSVQRDSNGEPQSLVGTDGGITTLELDGNSHLASVTDPAGGTTRVAWNTAGMVESETDPADGVVRFTYDPSGRLATLTDADGVVQHFDYDVSSSSLEVRVSTPQGRRWTYRAESSSDGIRRTFVAQDGTTSTETIDSHGARVLKLADGTNYNIGALSNPLWGMAAPILTPVVETRPDGVTSRRQIKYDVQPQRRLPYALAGSVTTTINGRPWIQSFDPAQRTTTLVDPAGRRTTSVYDAQSRVVNYSAPGVAPVSYTYDSDGRLASTTVGTGKLVCATRYTYNADGGEIIVTRPDGTIEKIKVNKAGQAVSATAGDGSTILANYDAAGRLIQVQPPGGLNYTIGSSPAGRPTGFAPPMVEEDASVETSSYDKDGQLVTISGQGNHAITVAYDGNGKIANWTFDQGQAAAAYDARTGRLREAKDPGGVTTSYAYAGDSLDHLAWSGPVSGSVSVALDANGRATREDVSGSNNLDFAYDAAGNLTGIGPLSFSRDATSGLVTCAMVGVVETKQEYDANGQLSRSTTSAVGKVVLDQRYTRDALGRIKGASETGRDGQSSIVEYSYDRADHLASVRVNGRAVETDAYDPAGNRISVIRPAGKVTANYDVRDRIVNWGSARYSWAPDGNLTRRVDAKGTTSFAYDDFGALRGVTFPDGRAIQYLVDADGRRLGRQVGGKLAAEYLYRPDGSIAAELDSAGKVVSRFGYDDLGHLALVERGGVTYRVITDAIGSPRLLIDSQNGTTAEEITYDAWGNVTRDTAPGSIPVGFAGGLRDPDTGLVRFGARDYDSETGRWTAADPVRFNGGDANLYRYAANDPVNLTDRAGLLTCVETGRSTTCYNDNPPSSPTGNQPWTGYDPRWNPPGYGGKPAGDLYKQFYERDPQGSNPPQTSNPPQNGNPPSGGNPPPNGNPPPWSCRGWVCGPHGTNKGGCVLGGCSQGPDGFHCHAVYCEEPNNPDNSCWVCGLGDPHLSSAGGVHFDFQTAGEFLVASAADGKVVIQARQQQWGDAPVAINTAVAANVNGDRVSVYTREPAFLMVNNAPVKDTDAEKRLPHGGMVLRHGGLVKVIWPDGGDFRIIDTGGALNYGYIPGPKAGPPLQGLLGSSGTKPSTDLVGRNGIVLSRLGPDFYTKLYRQVGDSWRIKQSESLFHYWPGESTATFTKLDVPSEPVNAASLSSDSRSKAEAVCRALGVWSQPAVDDCILDVSVTGMPAFAAASVGIGTNSGSARVLMASSGGGSAVAPAAGGAAAGAIAGQFSINIGDTVSPDHPASGAGIIREVGQKESYSFPAKAGAIIYVKVGPCDGSGPVFDLHDPANNLIGGTMGCGDFGPVTLPAAGTYRILTHSDHVPSRFTFSVLSTSADQFSIQIGDTVSPDHPVRGAGIIAQPGERQTYSFPGKVGAIVYVKVGPCDGDSPSFDLRDPANNSIGGTIGCGDFGPVTLPSAGTYKILTRTNRAAGHYAFSLLPTTLDQFSVKIGDTISPDHPAKGAGIIAQPGERQTYSFPGKAGAIVYVKVGPCDGDSPSFDLRDPANNSIGGTIGCGDFGPVTLPSAGTYKILTRTNRAAGHYAFSLLPTTLDRFSIKIGDTVSPGQPAKGAGVIAQLGQRQSYSFAGHAGELVYLGLGPCDGANPSFVLLRPDGGALDLQFGNCHVDIGRQTLPVAGTYRIVASTDRSNVSSRYSFYVHPVPPDQHVAVRLPLTVYPDNPARGAGRITAQGAEQFFDFTASPGTLVHIESKCSCPNLAIRAVSVGDNGRFAYMDLFANSKDDWKLPAGGKYTMQVRSNGFTGDYSFAASFAQPHR